MKRLLFALTLVALVLPPAPKAEAGVDVSLDFFYNNLGSDGSWVEVADYGYCWQPGVAVSNTSWRPYADGYWAYTDVGWTWISYEDFGWATYHYGRWARLRDYGWVWVPGNEWGPAWVSWRMGGDYVGWAPLPPRYETGGEVVYQGRPINSRVDIEFDIGPAYYNFVNVRYIGEPLLRERLYATTENITYINRTVNVTNITYNNSTVYNYGPDYNRLSAYSARPIQRLKLQRQSNIDYNAAAQAGDLTKVQGGTLVVAAPLTVRKSAQPIAPKQVKAKLAKADLETGWAGVSDVNTKAQLQQKMKQEDPKSVPPPEMKPRDGAAVEANASPAGDSSAAPASGATGTPEAAHRHKGKNKLHAADRDQPAGTTTQDADQNGAVASPTPKQHQERKEKNKRSRGDETQPLQQPAPDASVSPADANPPAADGGGGKGRGKGARDRQQSTTIDSVPASEATPAPSNERKTGGGNRARAAAANTPQPHDNRPAVDDGGAATRPGPNRNRMNAPAASPATASPAAAPVSSGPPEERGRGRRNAPEAQPQVTPQSAPPADQTPSRERGRRSEKPDKNKKDVGEPSPTVTPTP